jgi:hypothetical protein
VSLALGRQRDRVFVKRPGEETTFQVIKGDSNLVERCDIASKAAEFRADAM